MKFIDSDPVFTNAKDFYEKWEPMVSSGIRKLATRWTQSPEDYDDIAQQCRIRLFTLARDIESGAKSFTLEDFKVMGAYVKQLVRNEIMRWVELNVSNPRIAKDPTKWTARIYPKDMVDLDNFLPRDAGDWNGGSNCMEGMEFHSHTPTTEQDVVMAQFMEKLTERERHVLSHLLQDNWTTRSKQWSLNKRAVAEDLGLSPFQVGRVLGAIRRKAQRHGWTLHRNLSTHPPGDVSRFVRKADVAELWAPIRRVLVSGPKTVYQVAELTGRDRNSVSACLSQRVKKGDVRVIEKVYHEQAKRLINVYVLATSPHSIR